jgi:hypothetical protein
LPYTALKACFNPRFRVFTARYELSPYINRYAWSVSNRSLDALGTNYACVEQTGVVAAGLMNFGLDGMGRAVADMCLEELRTNFRRDIWTHNGPGLITRVLQKMCNCSSVSHRAGRAAWFLAIVIQLHDVITQCAIQYHANPNSINYTYLREGICLLTHDVV